MAPHHDQPAKPTASTSETKKRKKPPLADGTAPPKKPKNNRHHESTDVAAPESGPATEKSKKSSKSTRTHDAPPEPEPTRKKQKRHSKSAKGHDAAPPQDDLFFEDKSGDPGALSSPPPDTAEDMKPARSAARADSSAEKTKKSPPDRKDRKRADSDAAPVEGELDRKAEKPGQKQRFIVFVGNLPFTTTTTTLSRHFASVAPDHIRHVTQKPTSSKSKRDKQGESGRSAGKKGTRAEEDDGRSKGFAFLEFSSYDRMRTCLKSYHHSWFSAEGKSKAGKESRSGGERKQAGNSNARQINVELTAGGGGTKSNERRKKLKVKNERLHGQRSKELEKRVVEKERRAPTGDEVADQARPKQTKEGKPDYGGIHPSRMSRISK